MAKTGKVHPCASDSDTAAPPPRRPPPVPAAPPPRRAPPVRAPYRRPRRETNIECGGCCACCCCMFILLAIFFSIWSFIMACTLRFPRVAVESFHVSGLNTSSSAVMNTTITSELRMRNPNRVMGMKYDHIDMEVMVDGLSIGSSSIPSFSQRHKSSANFTFESSAEDLTLTSDTIAFVANNLTNVPLHAKMDVQAISRLGSMEMFILDMTIGCDLNVDLTRDSGSQLTWQHCKVDHWDMPHGYAYD